MNGILTDGSLGYYGPEADYRRSLRSMSNPHAEFQRALKEGRLGDARAIYDELKRVEQSKMVLIAQHLGPVGNGGGHDD